MRYGEGLLEEIRQRTDLVALVGRRVMLVRKGRTMWGCCPFHTEKAPSFKVENERKLYKCFGCGKSGDCFRWLMEVEKLTFEAAVEKLGKEAGVSMTPKSLDSQIEDIELIPAPGKSVFISYSHADEHLKDELLTHLAVLRREELISVWHDRMLMAGEHLDQAIEAKLAGSSMVLLLVSASFLNSDYCAEKEMIRAFERHHSGEAQVITIILRPCQWENMPVKPKGKLGDLVALPRDARPVTIYGDRDVAWNQIVAELRRFLSDDSRAKSGNETLSDVGKLGIEAPKTSTRQSAKQTLRPIHESLLSVVQAAEAAAMGRFFDGLASGLREVDSVLGGFRKSNLILIAGRPGMGATSLALEVVTNTLVARREFAAVKDDAYVTPTIAFFSFDMSSEQLSRRFLSATTGIPLWKIASGKFSEDEWEKFVLAMQDYSNLPLLIAEGPMSVDVLASEVTRLKEEKDLKCVVIDGLQRLTAWTTDSNESANCGKVIRELKLLASELSLPIIITSALPSGVDARIPPEPELSDLSDYGPIERFCDVVIFLYREFHYLRNVEPEIGTHDHAKWLERAERAYARADVSIDKNLNGSTADISLIFDENVGVFHELTSDVPEPISAGDK